MAVCLASLALLPAAPAPLRADHEQQRQQTDVSRPQQGSCGPLEAGSSNPKSRSVIEGRRFSVPALRLRLTDERTGQPLPGSRVTVRYVWQWFERPRSERPFGAWSTAYEMLRCTTDARGEVSVEALEVVPRGWYRGGSLSRRKPEFRHLDVSAHGARSIRHVRIKPEELRRERSTGAPLLINLTSQTSPATP